MRSFSFDQCVKNSAAMKDSIALVAKLWIDGDTYVVAPNPENEENSYRIARQDVHIADVFPTTNGPSSEIEPLYSVAVRKDAFCIRLDLGTVAAFWDASSEEIAAPAATQRVSIDFGANGEGTTTYNGVTRPCLGKPGLHYPQDLTINVSDKFRRRFSSEFGVWMDFALLIWGQRGIYIHQGPPILAENGGESAGCIHVGVPHAEELFSWISGRTRITLQYPW